MKYLLALMLITSFIACGEPGTNKNIKGSAENSTTSPLQPTRLITYLNTIALNTPGWDNNDMSRLDMQAKLSESFAKNMQDSSLLSGINFQLVSLERNVNNSMVATFRAYQLAGHDFRDGIGDSTRISFEVYSTVTDSLAKSLNDGAIYQIPAYTKDSKDTKYAPGTLPTIQNLQHTLGMCDLGLHRIQLESLRQVK